MNEVPLKSGVNHCFYNVDGRCTNPKLSGGNCTYTNLGVNLCGGFYDDNLNSSLRNNSIITTKTIQELYRRGFVDLDERFFDFFVVRNTIEGLKNDYLKKHPHEVEEFEELLDIWFPVFMVKK